MKTILLPVAVLGCATLAGLSAHAVPALMAPTDPGVQMTGSSDGGSLPGFPGGRGGKSGRELALDHGRYSGAADEGDRRLTDYCIDLLRSEGRATSPEDLRPADCANYFLALDGVPREPRSRDNSLRVDGRDGASIGGGVGGQGGRAGAGPGGGRGGAGGAGVGGAGGRGGAGGASD